MKSPVFSNLLFNQSLKARSKSLCHSQAARRAMQQVTGTRCARQLESQTMAIGGSRGAWVHSLLVYMAAFYFERFAKSCMTHLILGLDQ